MIPSFNFVRIPNIIFGPGKIVELFGLIPTFGKKVLFVIGAASLVQSGKWDEITRKLEDMNPTSRLKALNRLTKMTRDEKVEYIDNIKSMNTYLKEDIDTFKKREKIYIKLILNIGTALMDYIDVTKDLEGLDEDVRLKILNKWYNLSEANRKKDIQRMLR